MMKYSVHLMLTPQTIAYLKQCKMLLKNYEEVETELRLHDWDDHALEEVRQWYFEPINDTHDAHAHGHNVRLWKLLIIGSTITVWSVITIFLFLVAYEKLSTGNEKLDHAISNIIVGLPLMPKTVRYVLERSVLKSSAAKKATMEASMALNYDGLNSFVGLSSFDASIKGPFDFTDINKPQLSFNVAITKDFNMDLRMKNAITYFRVNKVPVYVTTLLGPEAETLGKYLNKWIWYDTSNLETEARKSMNTLSPEKSPTEQLNDAIFQRLVKKQILPKIIMEKQREGSAQEYKLHLDVTKDLINTIEEEFSQAQKTTRKDDIVMYDNTYQTSDYIDKSYVDMWINANDYYISKIIFSLKTKPLGDTPSMSDNSLGYIPGLNPSGSTIALVLALKYADYGKLVTVEVPAGALRFEDVYKDIITSHIDQQKANTSAQQAKYDIYTVQSAAERYFTLNNKYPTSIQELIDAGELPSDFAILAQSEKIYLKHISDVQIIIYSLIPDPSHASAPYYAVVLNSKYTSSGQSYSEAQLKAMLAGPNSATSSGVPRFQ